MVHVQSMSMMDGFHSTQTIPIVHAAVISPRNVWLSALPVYRGACCCAALA